MNQLLNQPDARSEPPPLDAGPVREMAPPVALGETNRNPDSIGFWRLLQEDFDTHDRSWTSQGFWALAVHRFGNWRMDRPRWLRLVLTPLYRCLAKGCEIFAGIQLSYAVPVGRRVKLEHFGGMILSPRSIGNDVTIRQNTTLGIASKHDLNARPTIEDGVDLGAHTVVIGDVVVGRHAIVGAGAVVIHSLPPYSVAVGVPARVIRTQSRLSLRESSEISRSPFAPRE